MRWLGLHDQSSSKPGQLLKCPSLVGIWPASGQGKSCRSWNTLKDAHMCSIAAPRIIQWKKECELNQMSVNLFSKKHSGIFKAQMVPPTVYITPPVTQAQRGNVLTKRSSTLKDKLMIPGAVDQPAKMNAAAFTQLYFPPSLRRAKVTNMAMKHVTQTQIKQAHPQN